MPVRAKEKILKGIAVSPGISIGSPYLYTHEVLNVIKRVIADHEVEEEITKYRQALISAKDHILIDKDKANEKAGHEAAAIFDTHLLIVEDEVLVDDVIGYIKENNVSASYAVSKVMRGYQLHFEKLESEYFSQRAFDVADVCRRVIKNIIYTEKGICQVNLFDNEKIIVSYNLYPSDTINFDKKNIRGIVTEVGGRTSHAAILARSMEVPAVVGVHGIQKESEKVSLLIIDGYTGEIILNPRPKTLEKYKKLEHEQQNRLIEDLEASKLVAVTKDGVRIDIASNVQSESEVGNVKKWHSNGIGLFRTEFLYEEKKGNVSEEQQYRIYKKIAEKIYPDKVIFRILDVGGDKIYTDIDHKEGNPFLGLRGIRFLFDNENLLIPHVRALLRATVKKNVWIMVPFVTTTGEMKKIREIIEAEKDKLISEGHEIDPDLKIGCMLEIPSAVIVADHIAYFSDFFSVGTNDLTQYTLAADRGNELVAYMYETFNPAVIRLLKMSRESAVNNNIPVSICGEMAGNPVAVPMLLGLGYRSLSVTPFLIPEIKKIIRKVSIKDCEELVTKILDLGRVKDITKILDDYFMSISKAGNQSIG